MKIAQVSVELLDKMGTDLSVVNAARVSMNKESAWEIESMRKQLSEKDARLIAYLVEHNHWTPFAHCFVTFRIKAPIFVARQLAKHQVGLAWNEVSRRYVDEEPEFWFPSTLRGRPEGNIKQGSGGENPNSAGWIDDMQYTCEKALELYQLMIQDDVAPEQARMLLPLNTMTEWIWSGSLAAWARVCNLRLDAHAQEETREIAGHLDKHMHSIFPISWGELMKGVADESRSF